MEELGGCYDLAYVAEGVFGYVGEEAYDRGGEVLATYGSGFGERGWVEGSDHVFGFGQGLIDAF